MVHRVGFLEMGTRQPATPERGHRCIMVNKPYRSRDAPWAVLFRSRPPLAGDCISIFSDLCRERYLFIKDKHIRSPHITVTSSILSNDCSARAASSRLLVGKGKTPIEIIGVHSVCGKQLSSRIHCRLSCARTLNAERVKGGQVLLSRAREERYRFESRCSSVWYVCGNIGFQLTRSVFRLVCRNRRSFESGCASTDEHRRS